MNRRALLAGLALGLIISRGALAADMPLKAQPLPPPPPAYSWTGLYVGGDVGGLWTHSGTGEWDPLPNVGFFGEFPISDSLSKRVHSLVAGTSGTTGNSRRHGLPA
jgi:hypothetical protein